MDNLKNVGLLLVEQMRARNSSGNGEPEGYKRVREPRKGDVVFHLNENNEMVCIRIQSGQFLSNGRVSNFWYWNAMDERGGFCPETVCGYGVFYKRAYKTNFDAITADIASFIKFIGDVQTENLQCRKCAFDVDGECTQTDWKNCEKAWKDWLMSEVENG